LKRCFINSLLAVLACFFSASFGVSAASGQDSLAITFYHYPPKIQVTDGVPSGQYIDQLEDIAGRAGYRVKWLSSDMDEEAAMLNAGRRAFCTTGRMPTKERAALWNFIPYLFDTVPGDTVLVRPDTVAAIKQFASITDAAKAPVLKGALLQSGLYGAEIDMLLATKPAWINQTGAMDIQLMKMVLAGRADWTIVPQEQWAEAKNQHAATENLVEITDFGAHPDYPIYIACSRALKTQIFDALAKAMGEAGFKPGPIPQ
jgi:Bacterial extracellular solute-binding proteins, family 3